MTSLKLTLSVIAALSATACSNSHGMEANVVDAHVAAPTATIRQDQAMTQANPAAAVQLVKTGDRYQLTRDGHPYFIKGGGGDGSQQLLHEVGGNSIRTWGVDGLDSILADAQKNGLTVTAGIWLGHKDNGFDYHNPQQVAAQYADAQKAILQYRNSPALLVWAIGNEMETGQQDDPAVWKAVEDIAAMAKKLDPNHPTMTVVAEIGGDKVAQINAHCPDIDIIGINSYGGGSSVGARYISAGGVKPYILTEFGPPGVWELPKNSWGATLEPTSTEKETAYHDAYVKSIAAQPLCLGSYAFTWGYKQEATATWFGLLLPNGDRLGPVDTLTQLWTGKAPADPCPAISTLKVDGPAQVTPGAKVTAALAVSSPTHDPLTVKWVLQADPQARPSGGAHEDNPPVYPDAIQRSSAHGAVGQRPAEGGAYRLFAYVSDSRGGAAVGNIPLYAATDAPTAAATTGPAGAKAALPLVLYGAGAATPPYTPSGYMGNAGDIKMDPASTDNPHSGTACLKVDYTSGSGWGGVVWQDPANDWGDKPGGWNLKGAKKLSFWARGAQGGEVVSFKYGLLGKDKTYSDTGTGSVDNVALTKEWKQYTIDTSGQDLSRIKTGFCWVIASNGHPMTFYLDDIKYE